MPFFSVTPKEPKTQSSEEEKNCIGLAWAKGR
jgi:hypothetical protein